MQIGHLANEPQGSSVSYSYTHYTGVTDSSVEPGFCVCAENPNFGTQDFMESTLATDSSSTLLGIFFHIYGSLGFTQEILIQMF